jgi:hypothetical protein
VWREGLLAQKVLQGQTKGYQNHPQLRRIKASPNPLGVIATYLRSIYEEAVRRGYQFDQEKINREEFDGQIACTRGQLQYEWDHLRWKLRQRDPAWYSSIEKVDEPEPHPLFQLIEGDIEDWEVGTRSTPR